MGTLQGVDPAALLPATWLMRDVERQERLCRTDAHRGLHAADKVVERRQVIELPVLVDVMNAQGHVAGIEVAHLQFGGQAPGCRVGLMVHEPVLIRVQQTFEGGACEV
jgi:hypothetical protein